jgi:hypothetical protein
VERVTEPIHLAARSSIAAEALQLGVASFDLRIRSAARSPNAIT